MKKRLLEIQARKGEISTAIPSATEEELSAFEAELDELEAEEKQLRRRENLRGRTVPLHETGGASGSARSAREERAATLVDTGRMTLPLFVEERSVLVSSGKLATPTAVYDEIGEMPSAISSIVDDVQAIDATGTGAWVFPYKKTDATAASSTEGQTRGGTGATFDKTQSIGPTDWSVLDEVSDKVKETTPVNYERAVRDSSYRALKVEAKNQIVTAVVGSPLLETIPSIPLDKDYLSTIILGYGDDETIPGGTKLYITKNDLATLGKIQGTGENRHYKIAYNPDMNGGTITDGALTVPFALTKVPGQLEDGFQLYGKPQSIKMLMWGDYTVTTDAGGDYFKRSMLGIKAEASANAALTVWHGMQLIKQGT